MLDHRCCDLVGVPKASPAGAFGGQEAGQETALSLKKQVLQVGCSGMGTWLQKQQQRASAEDERYGKSPK